MDAEAISTAATQRLLGELIRVLISRGILHETDVESIIAALNAEAARALRRNGGEIARESAACALHWLLTAENANQAVENVIKGNFVES